MLHWQVGAVHLRSVPPMRDYVAIGCWPALIPWPALMVWAGAQDGHLRLRPIIVLGDRKPQRWALWIVDAVAEPSVDHELQPRRQEQIDRSCRDEIGARQQLATNDPWIWLIKGWRLFAKGLRQRRIASKPCIRHSHPGFRQIVESAVSCPTMADVETTGHRRLERRGLGIEQ